MKKIYYYLLLSIILPSKVFAQSGSGYMGDYKSKYFGTGNLDEFIKQFYRWGVALGVTLAIVMLIIAGYDYATSAGDIEKINSAKEKTVGSVLGLLTLLLASLILSGLGVTS